MYIDYELKLDLMEAEFYDRYEQTLYVDIPPKVKFAKYWAMLMDNKHQTNHYSQMVNNSRYYTGLYCGYYTIAFPQYGADRLFKGFIAYRLRCLPFGYGEVNFNPQEWLLLDKHGNEIVDVKPLPLGGTDNPTPEQVVQYRKELKELQCYKDAHSGRSPEEEAAHQEKRKQWRQKDYLKNKKRGNDNNDKRQ